MRVLVFSDIHGNLPALENLIQAETVDEYINLGDVVNYGPWSNECVELISGLPNCYNIIGNHEEYFLKDFCDVKNQLVLDFFTQCIEGFKYKSIISDYNQSLHLHGFKLRHTIGVKDYIFHDTEVSIEENMMIGHSHQQYLREVNRFMLLNPGSVGQNRKFINVSSYVIWDTDTNSFDLKNIKYDFKFLIAEIKARKYPPQCIEYYTSKNQIN